MGDWRHPLRRLRPINTHTGVNGQLKISHQVNYLLLRNCRQWTSSINLYRGSFTQKTIKFWADPETRQKIRNIRVRTLQIFGTADKYLTARAAEDSAKYVQDHKLELLTGVSHWVQQEQPERVNEIMEKFLKKSE